MMCAELVPPPAPPRPRPPAAGVTVAFGVSALSSFTWACGPAAAPASA
jgi:hypothetical protein